MSDYLSWYLIELRTRLTPHLPGERVESILREAESRLREAAERHIGRLQISEDRAILTAIDAFGSPERVALTYMGQANSRVLGLAPLWLVLGSAAVAILCWDFHWMSLSGPFDNYGATWQNVLMGIAGFAALAAFVAGCCAGKRSYFKPLLAMSAVLLIGLVLFTSYWVVPAGYGGYQGVLRSQMGRFVAGYPKAEAGLERYEDFLKRGAKEYASAKTSADLTPEFADISSAERLLDIPVGRSLRPMRATLEGVVTAEGGYPMPSGNVFASPDRGNYYGIEGAESFAEAKDRWAKTGPRALSNVQGQRDELGLTLKRVRDAENGITFNFDPPLLMSIVSMTLVFAVPLLLVDWAVFAAIRRKRAWPVRGLA